MSVASWILLGAVVCQPGRGLGGAYPLDELAARCATGHAPELAQLGGINLLVLSPWVR